jgi:hypothetical protein
VDIVSNKVLGEIPFLRLPPGPASVVATLQFYVKGEWHSWAVVRGGLLKLDMWPHEADYFGDRSERDTDQHFRLLDMMAQRTIDHRLMPHFTALWNDIQGMSASLAKMRLFYANSPSTEYGIKRFVQTEIENLAVLCRSAFDVLQVLARLHIRRIQMLDGPRPQELPGSFRQVVLRRGVARTVDEIAGYYRLPAPLAQWYAHQAPFFVALRSIRDAVVHHGATVEMVIPTERGFAVSRRQDPFNGLYEWPAGCELEHLWVPVRPAMTLMARRTLDACDEFAATLLSLVETQEPMAPGLRLFTRGANDREFASMDAVIAEARWDDE